MAEKIKITKNKNNIKDDMIDLKIRSYVCDNTNNNESRLITRYFGRESVLLKGKHIPFFYNESLDYNGTESIKDYFKTIKQNLRYAFNTFEILQEYEDYIEVLDRPANELLKQKLPRYKKMKRLESLYEMLINFTLTVLHNFFWLDISLGIGGAGTKNLSYRIEQIMPLILNVKKMFEDMIDDEYPIKNFRDQMKNN